MRRRTLLLLACATPAYAETPCCGPITPAGERLAALLDSMDVEHRWLAHQHVNWQTGAQDEPGTQGHDRATHCSAFAAAVGLRLNVYMLRPPEHRQTFLATAQTQWFQTEAAEKAGWRPITDWAQAQTLANQGELVVIAYPNPDPHHPGHIVVVRPSLKSADALAVEGPQVIQAATRNKISYPASRSFNAHSGAWPSNVKIFAHTAG